jgi:hypothetical protein
VTPVLPPNFVQARDAIVRDTVDVEGHLSGNEMRFLCLLAAAPTTEGAILEIGSFKGKSTVLLAKAAALAGHDRVHAVDPLNAPSSTDPDLGGAASSAGDFHENLRRKGVRDAVTHHPMRSEELAPDWTDPLRLLWIDGDHTVEGTRRDLDGFGPHLADGAIVAIHDVLHAFEGGARVFAEEMLLSPHFGAAGVVGSIAWSQYHADPSETLPHRKAKLELYRRVARLIPFVAFAGRPSEGLAKLGFKLARWRVPHGPLAPERFVEMVARKARR